MQPLKGPLNRDDATSASVTAVGRVFFFDRAARQRELAEIALAVAAAIYGAEVVGHATVTGDDDTLTAGKKDPTGENHDDSAAR